MPVIGIAKNILFYSKAASFGGPGKISVRNINGLPTLVGLRAKTPRPGYPKKFVSHLEIDKDGRITGVHTTLATEKLEGINFDNFRRPEFREVVRAIVHAWTHPGVSHWLPALLENTAKRSARKLRSVVSRTPRVQAPQTRA